MKMESKNSQLGRLASCIAVVLLLAVGGCGGAPVAAVPSAPPTGVLVDVEGLTQQELLELQERVGGGWTQLELQVLDAFKGEGGSRPLGARYESDAGRLVLTVWSLGEEMSVEQLEDYRVRAEEVTGGIPVVIEVNDGEPVHEV
ncbi:MAG: hypothetical protein LBI99_05920 [Propionibacteriaceae bacterium]|jgi:hypothetical protein|nr:hypothetical protein [Propionibacteriaceae bacterium]